MTKIYLELDERKAKFFEYSKEPKEGFEKHESENGKVSYRKYYDGGAIGTLKFINEREEEFTKGKVKKLSIVLDNGDNRIYCTFNIMTSKGTMNQFVEQFIPFLPNMKQGEAYRLYPYEMENEYTNSAGEKKTGINRGISVWTYDLDNDTKVAKVDKAHTFGKDGDIPAVVWTEVKDMGVVKNVKDDRERRNFLYDVLQGTLTPFTPSEGGASTPAAGAEKKETPKTETADKPATMPATEQFDDEEHDDLPF